MRSDDKAQREIRRIAYGLWAQEGQPDGRDREHWERAKVIWGVRNHEDAETGDAASPGKPRARTSAARSA